MFADAPARAAIGDPPAIRWVAGADGEPPARVVTRDKAQAAHRHGVSRASHGRDPDRAAAQVWAAVASGLGGRLFEALRDRRSLAYTVVASAWLKARAGALVTYIATSPEREDEARDEMLRELERFAREPVSETELHQAVNYLAGQAEVNRQSGGGGGRRDPGGLGGRDRPGGAGAIPRPPSARSPPPTSCGWRSASLDPARRVEGGGAGHRGRAAAGGVPQRASPRLITSTPRPTSTGARATTDTKQSPSSGTVWSAMWPSRQSRAIATPLGTLAHDRRTERGHPHRAGGRDDDRRQPARVGEPSPADARRARARGS